jgi:hypothetical protein
MLSIRCACLAAAFIGLAASCCEAQYYRPYYGDGYGGYMPYGGTAAGSMAAGMGALIQSQGAYNQATAAAAIDVQTAKSMAIDNRLKSAQAQYQLERMNRENRVEQNRIRQAARVDYTPPPKPRMSSAQLDPVTGKIAWPALLSMPDFLPERTKLDTMFAHRVSNPASVTYSQVSSLRLAMRNKLDAMYERVDRGEFFAARHFLDALAEESRYSGLEGAQASVN